MMRPKKKNRAKQLDAHGLMLATTHNELLPSCHNLQDTLVNHHLAKEREESNR